MKINWIVCLIKASVKNQHHLTRYIMRFKRNVFKLVRKSMWHVTEMIISYNTPFTLQLKIQMIDAYLFILSNLATKFFGEQ